MAEKIVETYPTYDGLGDIISETRAWYRALGLQMGGSLFSVIRASEGITGLVNAIAKTLRMGSASKKVHIVVEDMPSIAYITPYAENTVVHVGSWLYSRDKMEKWHPAVKSMSESDMLVLTLGLINGAVALDMIAKATEYQRETTVSNALRNIAKRYGRRFDAVYVVESSSSVPDEDMAIDERYVYIASAIHDMLAIKSCLTEYRNASWIIFPLLLFREFFDESFAYHAKELISHDDTLDNLVACVSSLRCFSKHSASILDVNTSIGINIIKAMLSGTTDNVVDNSETAKEVLASEMLAAYIKEARTTRVKQLQNQEQSDNGSGSGNDGGQKSKNSKKDDDLSNPNQSDNGMVKNLSPNDASTPVNQDVAKNAPKKESDFKKLDEFGDETRMTIDHDKARMQEILSFNKKERGGKLEDSKNWLEQFMRMAFSGKIKFDHIATSIPATRSFQSVQEYCNTLAELGVGSYSGRNADDFKENILDVYNSIDKVSLRNLFMERTMDIEKSQPARSGIALIPTRIVNMFTDEKIFSPLPESETERDSEVIVLVDASGSMRGRSLRFNSVDGKLKYMSLYDGVVGAAYAMADGFQRANVICSVFAHSTLPGTGDTPFICKLTDQYSLNRMNEFADAGKIYSCNNADSCAIDQVAQHFSQDGRDIGRTLIVLSDGQPAFRGYRSDRSGDKMTRESAERLRKEGIKVYSISLTENVVYDNDRIYGKENNFFPVDNDGNGTVSLSPMLKRIVEIVAKNSVRSADNVLTQG
jgi:hypothetical protein